MEEWTGKLHQFNHERMEEVTGKMRHKCHLMVKLVHFVSPLTILRGWRSGLANCTSSNMRGWRRGLAKCRKNAIRGWRRGLANFTISTSEDGGLDWKNAPVQP